eukprot:TRINITY_DN4228_c0_g1_i1.p1 TRINITY_DN4228_c0_g1~~TRINITY_DN4228_c0_g1_i1.p1  ORF type:complete len:370 (-),score=76.18 TRINITY_DN4228_c0_g1_i1:409-1518(-)
MNAQKSDFVSELLARNKLAKDLMLAYDKLVQPDTEGTPQILVGVLVALGVFKKLGNSRIEALSRSHDGSNSEELKNAQEDMERREMEEKCCDKMWELLSFGNRSVRKRMVVGLVHAMLVLEDLQPIESKIEIVKEVLKISSFDQELISEITQLISIFKTLAKEVKESRYLTHFARKFRKSESPTEEKKIQECTFSPMINYRSRRLDRKCRMAERGNSQDRLEPALKRVDKNQRSQSPPRHNELYENYKKLKTNVEKKRQMLMDEELKRLPFRPKITKAAEKYKEENHRRVLLPLTPSSTDCMRTVRRSRSCRWSTSRTQSVCWMGARSSRRSEKPPKSSRKISGQCRDTNRLCKGSEQLPKTKEKYKTR